MTIKNWQVQILGLLLLALLFLYSIPLLMKKIPASLEETAQQELQKNGINWAGVDTHGRNITLSGQAPTIQQHQQALAALDKVYGSRNITDNMSPRIISPYTFNMNWTSEGLDVNGFVSDQKAYEKFLIKAFELYGKENVTGNIQLGAGAPDNWDELLQSSLHPLKSMEQGIIEITNKSVHVSGKSTTTRVKQKIQQDLRAYKKLNYQPSMHIVAGDAADLICQQRFSKLLDSQTIQFKSGKAIILPASFPLLKSLSDTAALCSKSTITISGHTDSQGNDESNLELSEKRAQAVLAWLFQQGIDTQKLNALGHGESMPIADNETESGRAKNRRIEFNVGDK